MITSCKDYLNPGFFQPDKDESSMVERHKELKQQEDERKKLIEETKTHYSRLVGQVPQIGKHHCFISTISWAGSPHRQTSRCLGPRVFGAPLVPFYTPN